MAFCLLVRQIVAFTQILAAHLDAAGAMVFMGRDVETMPVHIEHIPEWKCTPPSCYNPRKMCA